MANVKLKESGAAVVEEVSNQQVDAKGRVLQFRELNPLQESRLVCAVGAELAMNVMFLNLYAFPAAAVESIDGEEYPVPQSQMQIEGMLTILGKEGMNAVNKYLQAKNKATTEADRIAQEAAAKN